jgi:hypothetical protein
MLRPVLLTLVMTCTVLSRGEAQRDWTGRPAVSADSVAQSVLEAEERGRRHPQAVTNNADRYHNAYTGTHERRCVNADADSKRSGDFIAGPLLLYNDVWRQGSGKLWWHPNEMPSEAPMLTVHATRLDESAEARVFDSATIAWGSGPNASATTSPKFYPTGIRLPTVGRWMMVATAGNNWGCFVLTVR